MSYPYRIFLIDDDKEEELFFRMALTKLDHPVELTYEPDCKKAIQSLSNAPAALPDVIFLDWQMPKMEGRKCLEQIRQIPACFSIPLVIFSGEISEEMKEKAQGMNSCLVMKKPWTIDDLGRNLIGVFQELKFS